MTTLTRWNPIRDMAAMQHAMDRAFEDARRSTRGSLLALDVHESDTGYTVIANVPGIDSDAINVSLHDNKLTISAELPKPSDEDVRLLVQERTFGKFSRTVNLPQPVDSDAVAASYENGVLVLDLPKVPEVQPRQIPVKIGQN